VKSNFGIHTPFIMKQQLGFTLIELMVTLSVIGIMAAIATPSFSDLIQDNRLTTRSNELLAAVALTRSEAIKRGENVVICQSSTQSSCGGSNNNWHQGWMVFVDDDAQGDFDAGTDEILSVRSALGDNLTLSLGSSSIAYGGDGLASNVNANLSFLLCDDRGNDHRTGLGISVTGRVRQVARADLGNCP